MTIAIIRLRSVSNEKWLQKFTPSNYLLSLSQKWLFLLSCSSLSSPTRRTTATTTAVISNYFLPTNKYSLSSAKRACQRRTSLCWLYAKQSRLGLLSGRRTVWTSVQLSSSAARRHVRHRPPVSIAVRSRRWILRGHRRKLPRCR